MKENLEGFALTMSFIWGVLGIVALFAVASEKRKKPLRQKTSTPPVIVLPLILFILAGLFLIPGWDYFYTSGLLRRPVVHQSTLSPILASVPVPAPTPAPQPNSANSSLGTEQTSTSPSDPVYNNGWDGSVRQVKDWLKDNLKDPGSFDAIEWSPVRKTDNGGYVVRCKYRAKNSFGGYDIYNQIFTMDSEGNVLGYVDADN